MKEPQFTIAAVERDVGLSKDVLRVWERRYGFPSPDRDAHGERLYTTDQVQRLRLVKRLMDQGHRPGRLLARSEAELEALVSPRTYGATASLTGEKPSTTAPGKESAVSAESGSEAELDGLLTLVLRHDGEGFLQAVQQRLARQGLRGFVQDTVAPLTVRIGAAWEDGCLQIFEEHLFTEFISRVLRQAIAAVPGGSSPRVLLTSVPDEPHGMGLLMVEALVSLEGAHCISLGTQMPLLEIVQAAQAHRADAVALSFSAAFPFRQVPSLLQQLRAVLPPQTEIWAGGAGVRRMPEQDGIVIMSSLDDATAAVPRWRARRPVA